MSSRYGLLAFLNWNHDWNNFHFSDQDIERAIKQIKDLGIDTVRMDIVWSDIHTGYLTYDFSRYDHLIAMVVDHGLTPLVLLHYNKHRTDENGKEIWGCPPESYEEFAAYVKATVERYKNRVKYWEIWNEPNHPFYWVSPKDNLKSYVKLLTLSYAAAKQADPACVVLNGGITEPVVEDVAHFYESGGKDFCDILSIHTFLHPALPNVQTEFDNIIIGVRRIMEKHGDSKKKIWITEMGCPGAPDPKTAKKWWLGESLSEEQQADWLEKQYAFVKKHPFVEKLFWAFYRDTGGVFGDSVDHLGLVRTDFSTKPAFHRLKKLIHADTIAS